MRAKGIKRRTSERACATKFMNVPKTQQSTNGEYCKFQSVNYVLQTVKIKKKCLDAFDEKR